MTQLVDLNDDCLSYIFSYLSLFDLRDLETVCMCFHHHVNSRYRRTRHLDINIRNWSADMMQYYLTKVGSHLRSLKFSGGFVINDKLMTTYLSTIAQHCQGIQHLTVNYVRMHDKNQIVLHDVVTTLHTLDLSHCDLSDEVETFLMMAPKLRVLRLDANVRLTLTCLKSLTNIRELSIKNIMAIDYDALEVFLAQNSITHLSISYQSLDKISKVLNLARKSLISLEINNMQNDVLTFSELKNLQCLKLNWRTTNPYPMNEQLKIIAVELPFIKSLSVSL